MGLELDKVQHLGKRRSRKAGEQLGARGHLRAATGSNWRDWRRVFLAKAGHQEVKIGWS